MLFYYFMVSMSISLALGPDVGSDYEKKEENISIRAEQKREERPYFSRKETKKNPLVC